MVNYKLNDLLYEIKTNGRTDLINEIFNYKFIKNLIWKEVNKYKHNKDLVREVCYFVVKNIMIKFKLKNVEYADKQFKKYLYRVFHNTVSRQLKKEGYYDNQIPFQEVFVLEDDLEVIDNKVDLQNAIKMLDKKEQIVMFGLFFEDKSELEISQELNCTRRYVNRIKFQALEKLKQLL